MNNKTKTCPFCGGEILATAKKCKHCKQFLPDKEEATPDLQTKTCPFCGEEILVTAKKCKHCGEWLNIRVGKDFCKKIDKYALLVAIVTAFFVPTSSVFIVSLIIFGIATVIKLIYEKRIID